MNMARVHTSVASRDYPEHDIKKGDTYYHWKPFRSSKRFSKTPPKPQQLTDRDELISLYDAQDAGAAITWDASHDDVAAELDGVAELLQNAADAAQEKYDNMPENFQQGERGQQLEQFVSECDDAIGELENIKDEIDPENWEEQGGKHDRTDLSDLTWPEEF